MLVAGTYVEEDLAGETDSWANDFEKIGISVMVETKGIGYSMAIIDIFCDHIQEALDIIPNPLAIGEHR